MRTSNLFCKVSLLLAAYVAVLVADGCRNPCPSPQAIDFHSMSMGPSTVTFGDSLVQSKNSGPFFVDRRRDRTFSILLVADREILARRQGGDVPFGIITPSYARTPVPCPFRGYIHWITSMDVVSDADWDADHPAGTSLADLITLSVQQKNDNYTTTLLSKMVFDEAFHRSIDGGDANFSIYGPKRMGMFLSFPHPPSAGRHVFTLKVSKSNGNDFEQQSIPVIWD